LDVVENVDLDEKGKVKYHFIIVDYLVKVKSGEVKAASDAGDLKWVPLDEAEEYDLTSSFRVFFRRNRRKLQNA
jgi:8-oxo-dGTP diphosphatase